jgi:preprotein translocase subunit SecY
MKKYNVDLLSIWNCTELRKRLIYTAVALVVFKLGSLIPIVGVPRDLLLHNPLLARNLTNIYDLFAGGTLGSLSVLALGIGPYISASIALQLLMQVIPSLKHLREDGFSGQRELKRLTRWTTLVLAFLEAITLSKTIATSALHAEPISTLSTIAILTLVLTAGSMFVMWLSEQITEHGIGNGSSLMICAGIISRLPAMIQQTYFSVESRQVSPWAVAIMVTVFAFLAASAIALQNTIKKIPLAGGKELVRSATARPDYLYLPLNPSGVMPIVFASQVMFFLGLVGAFVGNQLTRLHTFLLTDKAFGPVWSAFSTTPLVQNLCQLAGTEGQNLLSATKWEYYLLYASLVVYFGVFYASIVLPPQDIATSLRKSNRSIQGLKPGAPTLAFLKRTVNRLSLVGAAAIALIAIVPMQAAQALQIETLAGFGSTSLIILTSVAVETQRQMKTHILSSRYHTKRLLPPSERKSNE